MASTRSGYIPANLRIFSRVTETFKMDSMWGSGWWRSFDKDVVHEIRGRKAFAVDRDSKGYKILAERWSKSIPWLTPKLDRLEILFECGDVYEDVPNAPITGARIISLEHRGQGGRAYKVVTKTGYCYDLREDQLLEAMIEVGVARGGILGGEWVWGVVGSQMKLIRVGSKQHADLVATTIRRNTKKVSAKDLTPGTIYSRVNGNRQVFCGFVSSLGVRGKQQLWWEPYAWTDPTKCQADFNDDLLEEEKPLYVGHTPQPGKQVRHFKLTKSHSCVSVDGTIDIPADTIEQVRAVWYGRVMNEVALFTTRRASAEAARLRTGNPRWGNDVMCPQPGLFFENMTVFAQATMHAYKTNYVPTVDIVAAKQLAEEAVRTYKERAESGALDYGGGYFGYYSSY